MSPGSFDYIVVGAGSAGCALAGRLSEDPDVSVLLLEAGGSDNKLLYRIPAGFAKMTKGIGSWGWSTVPQKHMNDRVLWYTQAKVMGGGSTINAQVYTRGAGGIYDQWADEDGCEGWSFREVLPYFKRCEDNQRFVDDYHGYGGPVGVSMPIAPLPITEAFIRAGQEAGLPYTPDFNGAEPAGVGYYQLTQRNAARSSASGAYLGGDPQRTNLTIRQNTLTTRIVVDNGRAVGVEAVAEGASSPEKLRAEREVIVASGAIGSPKLLMQSGIGPADHLKSVGIDPVHDLPGVGSNLQDHLDLFIISECTGDHSYDGYARLDRTVWAGIQYFLFKRGPAASSLFETGAFWFADDAAPEPDLQFHFGQGSGIEKGVARMTNPGVTLNAAYVQPRSRGSVRLNSADPAEAPLIDPNYWADPHDWKMGLKGLRLAREILRQDALKPYIEAERLPGPDVQTDEDFFNYACANAKTQHHPAGTCKMGTDAMAVVAPDLTVRGLEGLRVCDSSIMPRVSASNTNAATIMIGEKGADLVRGRDPLPPALFAVNRGPADATMTGNRAKVRRNPAAAT